MHEAAYFTPKWLALREPVDHRSRAHDLAVRANRYLRLKTDDPCTVVDLGAGSGSNFRYLKPRLDPAVHWQLVDHDPNLLAALETQTRGCSSVATRFADLSEPLWPLLANADLVTASALLDLTSADWINDLCSACAAADAAILIALTIDGRVRFSHAEAEDLIIQRAVIRDQRRDKGLGPALGSEASTILINALAAYGYAVTTRPSDWHLDHRDKPLACALVEGWRQAAQRQNPLHDEMIAAWARRRTAAIVSERERLTLGHVDILALPNPHFEKSRS